MMASAGEVVQLLQRTAGGHVAVVMRKPDHRIFVGHIHPLRIGSERIEGDAEGSLQPGRKNLYLLRLTLGRHAAKNLDVSCAGFGEKQVAVGIEEHEAAGG